MSVGKGSLLDDGLKALDNLGTYKPTAQEVEEQCQYFRSHINIPGCSESIESVEKQISRWREAQAIFDPQNKFPRKIAIYEAALIKYKEEKSKRWKRQVMLSGMPATGRMSFCRYGQGKSPLL